MREKADGKFGKKTGAVLFLLFLAAVPVIQTILPDKQFSVPERRMLAKTPELTFAALLDGSFMDELEVYLLEQFPARDSLRTVKAQADTVLFGKKDSGGYFKSGDGIYKLETELNEKNIKRAAVQFEKIMTEYFSGADCYYAVIPDKNYFLEEQSGYPVLDYERLNDRMAESINAAQYLNLYEKLELEDYYRTDLHWKQERIFHIAEFLAQSMTPEAKKDAAVNGADDGTECLLATDTFLGGYAAASAFPAEKEPVFYYENEMIQNMRVYDYEKNQYVSVYAPEKLGAADDYDFYLWGARALLTIENPSAKNEEKLLIFRDSFGSSIAPLLAQYYGEVTLVDLRYVSVSYAMKLLSEKQYEDVLFLYSASMLNNSDSMRFM